MIYNKTKVIGFLICVLLFTTSYGMEQEITQLWDAATKHGYKGADLLNDVLISTLIIDPTATTSKSKLKQEEEHARIIKAIGTVRDEKKGPEGNVNELATKVLLAKKTMANLIDESNDEWPRDSIPTSNWNKVVTDEAIQLIQTEKINPNGMLKIIDEIIDQKAQTKGSPRRTGWFMYKYDPLEPEQILETKKNIKKAIEEKIKATKAEAEEIKIEEKKEIEKIKEITKEKEEKEEPTVIVEEKVLLEKPLKEQLPKEIKSTEEIKPTEQLKSTEEIKPTEQLKSTEEIKLTEEIKPTEEIKLTEQLKEEKEPIVELIKETEPKTIEAAKTVPEKKQPEVTEKIEPKEQIIPKTIESSIEEAIDSLLKQHDTAIKAAYKEDEGGVVKAAISPVIKTVAEQFPDHLGLVQELCTAKLETQYGKSVDYGQSPIKLLVGLVMKPYTAKKTATEKAEKQAKEKLEAEREKAQKLLKSKVGEFNSLIKKAKEEYKIETTEIEKLAKKAAQEDPLAKEEIDDINAAFVSLQKLIKEKLLESMKKSGAEIKETAEKEVEAVEEKLKKLEPKFGYFKNLITKAELSESHDKKLLQKFKNIIEQKIIYSLEDIANVESYFANLAAAIKKEEGLTQEKKSIEAYPSIIAAEIEENEKKGIGTVIVHPDAKELIEYIRDLAKKVNIEIVSDKWFDITDANDINKEDPFKFKQLSDGTIEYLKAPDENNSTIMVNDNVTYIWDYTFVPKIEKKLKEMPTLVYSGQIKKELEERIITTAKKHALKAKERQEADQDKKDIMGKMQITEEQAEEVLAQQKNLYSQIDLFTELVLEAKKIDFDNIEQFTEKINFIKNKQLYSVKIKDVDAKIEEIETTFKKLKTALETALRVEIPEDTIKEIKENQLNDIGTVIVHRDAKQLINYIKDLAQQYKITIIPNTWLNIKIGEKDTFKFKQLSDGTLEYLKLKSSADSKATTIATSHHILDFSFAAEIKEKLTHTEVVSPEKVLANLKKRINAAKLVGIETTIEPSLGIPIVVPSTQVLPEQPLTTKPLVPVLPEIGKPTEITPAKKQTFEEKLNALLASVTTTTPTPTETPIKTKTTPPVKPTKQPPKRPVRSKILTSKQPPKRPATQTRRQKVRQAPTRTTRRRTARRTLQ